MKCIYSKDDASDLTYKGQEHVFPASLGGKLKLGRGTVSDEINNLFSEHEKIALRETFLYINRANIGPGKRGSNNPNKMREPQAELYEVYDEEVFNNPDIPDVQLGFTFMGTVYIFTQLVFSIEANGLIKQPKLVLGTLAKTLSEARAFRTQLLNLLNTNQLTPRNVKIVLSDLPSRQKSYIIAIFKTQLYVSLPSVASNFDFFVQAIKSICLSEGIPVISLPPIRYHFRRTLPKFLDESFLFIYVKTAFNVLAFHMGVDFVLESQFDAARDAIVQCSGFSEFLINKQMPDWLVCWVRNSVPPKAHFVVIHGYDRIIEAYVSFYREPLNASICLSDNYSGDSFKKFFVCNHLEHKDSYGDIPQKK